MKTFKNIHIGLAILVFAGVGLSINAYAVDYDSSADHNHGGMLSDENMKMRADMARQGNMPDQMKTMRAQMQAIVDTDDKAKRLALFTAHKQKMQGMMKNMQGNCNNMKKGKSTINHQGETD